MADVSIIVVNYMTYDITLNTIQSIFDYVKCSFKIILVDNASPNGEGNTLRMYYQNDHRVTFVQSEINQGFGSGNNLGLGYVDTPYILYLNSDTELTNDCVSAAIDYLNDNESVGAVSAKLITSDGKLDGGCRRGFPTPLNSLYYFLRMDKIFRENKKYGGYKLSYLDENEEADVDAISGAFLFTRKSIIDRIGAFDESFFMYGEDLDLCFRLKEAGYRVVYKPDLGTIIHYKGASGKKRKWKTIYNFYDAMIIFYRKNYKERYPKWVYYIVCLGVYVMFTLKVVANLFKRY